MLYGRWRSRHRVSNIKKQGDDKLKMNKRRVKKNSRIQDVSNFIDMKWEFYYISQLLYY